MKEKNIPLAKVDCTEEQELCKKYGVEGYPTLKVFRGLENISPYGGQRKADSLISYMTKQALPAVSEVTKDTLEEFKTADKVVLVAYFAADDKASNETFTSVANGLRDNFLFGATFSALAAWLWSLGGWPAVVDCGLAALGLGLLTWMAAKARLNAVGD